MDLWDFFEDAPGFIFWIPLFIALIASFRRIQRIERFLRLYRDRLHALEIKLYGEVQTSKETIVKEEAVKSPKGPLYDDEPQRDSLVWKWMRENWMATIGGVFVLIAAGWLARYSIMHNYVGPVGRISMGLLLGLAVMGLAVQRIPEHTKQGSLFAVLGTAIVLVVLNQGQASYHLYPALVSMSAMMLAVAFLFFIAVRYKIRRLVYVGVIAASIVPVLVETGGPNFVGLFSYLAIVFVGTLWVDFVTGWRRNVILAFTAVVIYSVLFILDGNLATSSSVWEPETVTRTLVMFTFALAFFASSVVVQWRQTNKTDKIELGSAILVGGHVLLWIYNVVPEHHQAIITSAWALLFCVVSYVLTQQTRRQSSFFVYGGIGVMLLAFATAFQFSGPVLAVAFALESALLPVLVHVLFKDEHRTRKAASLLIVPAFMAVNSIGAWHWHEYGVIHMDAVLLLLVTVVSFGLAAFLFRIRKASLDTTVSPSLLVPLHVFIGTFYGGTLLWHTLHAILPYDDMATFISLTVFMLFGLACYVAGYLKRIRFVKLYGGLVIGWVVFRVVFVDMPDMSDGGRVITFFILGGLLLGTAFLENKRRKSKI